jgi:NAD(P)-dependent dehydrogenase (short-subunit alcohol dehydrogenase family)
MTMSVASAGEMQAKVCVVTGAGRGLGLAIAQRLGEQGGTVVVIEKDEGTRSVVESTIPNTGDGPYFVTADIGDETAIVNAATSIEEQLGRIDVLVNNAGIGGLGPSLDFETAVFRRSLDVMVVGTFLCSREFGRVMRRNGGGVIVNISSINGLVAFPMRLAYSASKAAVISMTEVLAVEWARYGIRVNAVAPGSSLTAMLQEAIDQGLIDVDAYVARTPLGRLAEPADIAEAVAFLCSDRSGYVTGQVLAVDGGWTAYGWVPWNWDPDRPVLSAKQRANQ